ncbi:MAG: WG repeat-containing protein [Lachnospiraceae bacterium]|nr:WG repeat-containing protein [Lachnospiraceae bacterium]
MAKKRKNVVKQTQSLTGMIILAMVALTWVLVMSSVLDNSEEQEQLALVESARSFWADKLYIRAESAYLSALNNYSTEYNDQYESELMEMYLEEDNRDDYMSIVTTHRTNNTATEEEYIRCAEWLLEDGDESSAYSLLVEALGRMESDTLRQMYESVRYSYQTSVLNVTEYLQPATNWIIPISNGENWGYSGAARSLSGQFIYEEALHFSGSYAVVKLDGVYTLIDSSGNWMAIDKIGLDQVTDIRGMIIVGVKDGSYGLYYNTFVSISDETYENIYLDDSGYIAVKKDGKWAFMSSDLKLITDYQFDEVVPNCNSGFCYGSYAVVKDSGGYYVTLLDGTACSNVRYADAKGIESGLVAVADSSGKWGYINEKGELIVPCEYDDAYSMSCGLGAVKVGDEWGYISRYGDWIISCELDSALPFQAGSTLVEQGGKVIKISLKYYE